MTQRRPSFEQRVAVGVRLAVLVWSAGLLTLSYLQGPKGDVTFVASIFTASLASFGVERAAAAVSGSDKRSSAPSVRKKPAPKP